jgi:hypothetical protein
MWTRLAPGALVLLALASAGCNKTAFWSVAPAKQGWVYVVGAKNDRAQGWLCPSTPRQGGCKEIEIEVEDK